MAPTAIIDLSNRHTSKRARAIIKSNQDGRCLLCNVKFDLTDVVVSHGSAKRRYYHEKCAKRLNII
jgi:hypothetical protein